MKLREYDEMFNRDTNKFDFSYEKDVFEFQIYTYFVCSEFYNDKRDNLIIGKKINNKTYDVFQEF